MMRYQDTFLRQARCISLNARPIANIDNVHDNAFDRRCSVRLAQSWMYSCLGLNSILPGSNLQAENSPPQGKMVSMTKVGSGNSSLAPHH